MFGGEGVLSRKRRGYVPDDDRQKRCWLLLYETEKQRGVTVEEGGGKNGSGALSSLGKPVGLRRLRQFAPTIRRGVTLGEKGGNGGGLFQEVEGGVIRKNWGKFLHGSKGGPWRKLKKKNKDIGSS